jgi:hypothetical protein
MSELNLSNDARRCLWRCYSLLLRLAEEAERDTAADPELVKGHESAAATEANELTRPDHDTPEAWSGQMEAEVQIKKEGLASVTITE